MIKYLVTGTPRSGTGYMAELLTSNGVPCTHEKLFRITNHIMDQYPSDAISTTKPAESSWLAAPYVSELLVKIPELKVIQVIRDPVKVIQSFLDLNFFTDYSFKMPRGLIGSYIGQDNLRDVDGCMSFILLWYSFLEKIPEKLVVNIDDMDYNAISNLLEIDVNPVGHVVNDKSHAKRKSHSREEVLAIMSKSDKYYLLKELAEANNIFIEV